MAKLIETRIQKFILLVGGILIFIRLYDVSFYERYNAILQSIGIAVLTFILLAILKGYDPMRIWKFIRRYKKFLLGILALAVLALGIRAYIVYEKSQEALAYQRCMRKVIDLSTWETRIELDETKTDTAYIPILSLPSLKLPPLQREVRVEHNKYYDEWEDAGRPYSIEGRGQGVAFMKWMMESHPDFCSEYNPDLIQRHIDEK